MDNPYPEAADVSSAVRLLGFPTSADLGLVKYSADQLASQLACPRLLVELSASNSPALQITSEFGGVDAFWLLFEDLVPAVADAKLRLRFSTDAGGSWLAANYKDGSGATDGAYLLLASDLTKFPVAAAAGDGVSGAAVLQNVSSSGYKKLSGHAAGMTTGAAYRPGTFAAAYRGGAGVINGLQVAFDSGNIASGRVRAIGI